MRQRSTQDQRHGNFFADFPNFRRKTEARGWEFSALTVLIDGLVVYKLWSGTPEIHEHRDQTNPLGPLQGTGPSLSRPEFLPAVDRGPVIGRIGQPCPAAGGERL